MQKVGEDLLVKKNLPWKTGGASWERRGFKEVVCMGARTLSQIFTEHLLKPYTGLEALGKQQGVKSTWSCSTEAFYLFGEMYIK